jgi:TetR/AcrR family transcriptional repressor of bet genes
LAQQNSKAPARGRAATKALRRQQLIDATIDSIAKRGFSETTLADVADGAGLSRGIVNFHFKSKEMLLVETLRYMAEEYREAWTRALEKAGPAPAGQLAAMVEIDFDPVVCSRKKVAVWYAFYGEAKSRPTYLDLCHAEDLEQHEVLCGLCRRVIEEGGYEGLDPELIATGFGAMSDGFWLDMLIQRRHFDRAAAKRACYAYLASVFPRHFSVDRATAA